MTRLAAPKLGAYAGLAAAGLLASLVLGRPELAAISAPFVLFLVIGLARVPDPVYRVSIGLDRRTAVEGESVRLQLEIACARPADRVEVTVRPPAGLAARAPDTFALRLGAGTRDRIAIPLRCDRWGAYARGSVTLRAHDRLGLFEFRAEYEADLSLKVYPRTEHLRTFVHPAWTLPLIGSLVSRERGEGIEFAEVRPFVRGDRVRSVNWRATARRGGLWVTDRHPERNADVVLFLDAFSEVGGAVGTSLEVAVRLVGSLAIGFLRERDRVGLVSFGGILRWLFPGTGWRQLYRIVDALLDTELTLSYAWKGIDIIPPRTLPARSLVIAVTPLLDERTVAALLDLRGRGFDLAVVEVPPERFLGPPADDVDGLARRVWAMKRDLLRRRFERLDVGLVGWDRDVPLEALVKEVQAFRRRPRVSFA